MYLYALFFVNIDHLVFPVNHWHYEVLRKNPVLTFAFCIVRIICTGRIERPNLLINVFAVYLYFINKRVLVFKFRSKWIRLSFFRHNSACLLKSLLKSASSVSVVMMFKKIVETNLSFGLWSISYLVSIHVCVFCVCPSRALQKTCWTGYCPVFCNKFIIFS